MRRSSWLTSGLALWYAAGALADYGSVGTYPPPRDLTGDDSLVAAAWKNLTETFDLVLKEKDNGTTAKVLAGLDEVTFSLGMFSLHDVEATQLQYHYTSPEIANGSMGTRKVDENSIYRIASVSKLITVFAGMLELSNEDWNRPLTEINPEFEGHARSIAQPKGIADSDAIWQIEWDKITPWALATQLSGIPTIGVPIGDVYSPLKLSDYGTPPLDITSWNVCENKIIQNPFDQYCDAPDSIAAVKNLPPNFPPWTTPAYADLGYMILGVAISNITGKPMTQVYSDSVFKPLDMKDSSATHPTQESKVKRSVIAGIPAADWSLEPGFTVPSGGLLSTISDLQKLGFAMLNHTLLSPEATRKWMKPQSHTASLSYSIGAPWEIHRVVMPGTDKVIDLYTKLGDSGYYGGTLVLIPAYDAGFTLLNGSGSNLRSTAILTALDLITDIVLPALEAQALAEARRNFAGTYKSTGSSVVAEVTIAYNKSTAVSVKSDLMVTAFMYNGTNVLEGSLWGGVNPRLERSINAAHKGSSGSVAFELSSPSTLQTSTYMEAMQNPKLGVVGSWTGLYYSNGDFVFTDQGRWGGISFDMMVFDVDETGKATYCIPAVDRIKLKRVDDGEC